MMFGISARCMRPHFIVGLGLSCLPPSTFTRHHNNNNNNNTTTDCVIYRAHHPFQLDEINQLFLPNMRNKLLWFYQEVDEPEVAPVADNPKPGPSRAGVSTISKTPQGWPLLHLTLTHMSCVVMCGH